MELNKKVDATNIKTEAALQAKERAKQQLAEIEATAAEYEAEFNRKWAELCAC